MCVGGLEKRREGEWGFGLGVNKVLCSSARDYIFSCTHTYMCTEVIMSIRLFHVFVQKFVSCKPWIQKEK